MPDTQNGLLGLSVDHFVGDVRQGNAEGFMRRLEAMFASMPYSAHGSREDHYQNLICLLFSLLGFYTQVERRVCGGRIDQTVETAGNVYLFEFKVDSRSGKGMDQLLRKRYDEAYRMSGKRVWLIAASFSTRTGRLTERLLREATDHPL